jgi:hypothetical protein
MPTHLDDLYAKMWASMEIGYHESCSKILQLHHALPGEDLEFLYRSLIADVGMALAAPISNFADQPSIHISTFNINSPGNGFDRVYSLTCLMEYMETILYTRCVGLLEVFEDPSPPTFPSFQGRKRSHIHYIQRTARDFVHNPTIWGNILTWAPNFDPHTSILATRVFAFKTNCHFIRPLVSIKMSWDSLSSYAWNTTNSNSRALLLDEFNRAAVIIVGPGWTRTLFPAAWKVNWLSLAVKHCLFGCVKRQLLEDPLTFQKCPRIPSIAFVLLKSDDHMRYDKQIDGDLLNLLLGHGINPNESYRGHSIWRYFIHYLHASGEEWHFTRWAFGMIRIMLKHGTDPDICCLEDLQIGDAFLKEIKTIILTSRLVRDILRIIIFREKEVWKKHTPWSASSANMGYMGVGFIRRRQTSSLRLWESASFGSTLFCEK